MRIQNINSNSYVNIYQGQKSKAPEFKANVYSSIPYPCEDFSACQTAIIRLCAKFGEYAIRLRKVKGADIVDYAFKREAGNRLGLFLFDGTKPEAKELAKHVKTLEETGSNEPLYEFLDGVKAMKETEKVDFSMPLDDDICSGCFENVPVQDVQLN